MPTRITQIVAMAEAFRAHREITTDGDLEFLMPEFQGARSRRYDGLCELSQLPQRTRHSTRNQHVLARFIGHIDFRAARFVQLSRHAHHRDESKRGEGRDFKSQ
jgi:hypothetical protein